MTLALPVGRPFRSDVIIELLSGLIFPGCLLKEAVCRGGKQKSEGKVGGGGGGAGEHGSEMDGPRLAVGTVTAGARERSQRLPAACVHTHTHTHDWCDQIFLFFSCLYAPCERSCWGKRGKMQREVGGTTDCRRAGAERLTSDERAKFIRAAGRRGGF